MVDNVCQGGYYEDPTRLSSTALYRVQVRAASVLGGNWYLEGPWSESVTASPSAPAAPTGFKVAVGDALDATLSWGDPNNAAITGYQYRVNHNATATGRFSGWGNVWHTLPNSDAATTSHTFSNLSLDREYRYQLRAVDAGGPSPAALNAAPWFASAAMPGPSDRRPSHDFETLSGAGNTAPVGMWSDGTTMWVTDYTDGKIYAYKMSDKSRDPAKDFSAATLSDEGNTNPGYIWVGRHHHVGHRLGRRQDLCVQDVGQVQRPRQGLRHPQRRRQHNPRRHVVGRHHHVGRRPGRRQDLRWCLDSTGCDTDSEWTEISGLDVGIEHPVQSYTTGQALKSGCRVWSSTDDSCLVSYAGDPTRLSSTALYRVQVRAASVMGGNWYLEGPWSESVTASPTAPAAPTRFQGRCRRPRRHTQLGRPEQGRHHRLPVPGEPQRHFHRALQGLERLD